jgi:hypothetical protein
METVTVLVVVEVIVKVELVVVSDDVTTGEVELEGGLVVESVVAKVELDEESVVDAEELVVESVVDRELLELDVVDELENAVLLLALLLLLIKCLSSWGHSRAFPFLGTHPMPVVVQLEVEGQASISC